MEPGVSLKTLAAKYPPTSARHVVLHAGWQHSRGRRPSLRFNVWKNPAIALERAARMLRLDPSIIKDAGALRETLA